MSISAINKNRRVRSVLVPDPSPMVTAVDWPSQIAFAPDQRETAQSEPGMPEYEALVHVWSWNKSSKPDYLTTYAVLLKFSSAREAESACDKLIDILTKGY